MSGDSGHIAQIRACSSSGVCRGSGYRVENDLVLTAAHVVADADQITLAFNADLPAHWEAEAEVAARCGDLALLRMKPPIQQSNARRVYARYGHVGSRISTVRFIASGFPVWQLRVDPGISSANKVGSLFRDAAQVTGSFPTASGWREGMFELLVDRPPAEMNLNDPMLTGVKSEWEGMSGAAVWVGDRIVGVISAHVQSEGLGQLRATRLEQLYRHNDDSALKFRELLHLPADVEVLTEVVPMSHGERIALEFEGDVREVAPSLLLDRDLELADLHSFCLSEEQYVWIQAPAWSGKTALSSWLALNPPPRVEIVAFFIVKRQIGRADVNAFLDSALAQLSIFAPVGDKAPVSLEEKRRKFSALLERGAAQALADGRRLTLLVDGLDEDVSNSISLPSIASVLPVRPIQGLNVLVTGRRVPVPTDVHGSHPMRACRVYSLNPSPHAKTLEEAARTELAATLQGDDYLSVDILAFLSVSGGGLTSQELQALTEAARLNDIKNRLRGSLGRSLAVHAGYGGESIYLFDHATLAETAREHFRDEERQYSDRLHSWASKHIYEGWSASTPQFLLGRYFRLLSALGAESLPRMIELATSEERHDLMLARTNGDWDGLAEIELTRAGVAAEPRHHLLAAARLSIEHTRLVDRSATTPLESGPLWARMGDTVRARMTAFLIANSGRKDSYLVRIATALAETGDVIQAREVAEEVSNFRMRLRTLAVVGAKFAEHQDYKHAGEISEVLEENARSFPDRSVRAEFLTLAATCFSLIGGAAHAEELGVEIEELAAQFNQPKSPVKAAVAIAGGLAALGQTDRAWRISSQISEPTWHAEALCAVVVHLPESDARKPGALEATFRAREKHMAVETLAKTALELRSADPKLAEKFLSEAWKIGGRAVVPSAVGRLAVATGVLRELSTGLRLLESMEPVTKVAWLCTMSRTLSAVERIAEALQCAEMAEAATLSVPTGPAQTACLIDVADSYLAASGRVRAKELVERAEDVARQTASRSSVKHWANVALSLARAGHLSFAEVIVDKICASPEQGDKLRLEMVEALSGACHLEKAFGLARSISDDSQKFRGYLHVVTAYAGCSQLEQQEELLREAVDFYENSTDVVDDQPEVIALIEHMAGTGGWGKKAETLAASYAFADVRSVAAYAIARAAARVGNFDRALQFTASGYLETHRARSSGIDSTGIVDVAEALDRTEVDAAMRGFERLNDERLRCLAAKWILKSSLELTEGQREALGKFNKRLTYVSGVGRALIEAEMPERLSELLSTESVRQSRETYLQALIEGIEAAVTSSRTDLAIHFLKSLRAPGEEGTRLLGYCLAAHGKPADAWRVLRDEEYAGKDDVARMTSDVTFLHKSIQGQALVSMLNQLPRDEANNISDRLMTLVQRADLKSLMDATAILLTDGSKDPGKTQALLSKLRNPAERVEVLSRAVKVLINRRQSDDAAVLVRTALDIIQEAPDEPRGAMFSTMVSEAFEIVETKDVAMALCQAVSSGPLWPYALPALTALDPSASDRVASYLARVCPAMATTRV